MSDLELGGPNEPWPRNWDQVTYTTIVSINPIWTISPLKVHLAPLNPKT